MFDHAVLHAVIAEILETEPGTVHDDDDLETLGWDSLSDLNLISIADERYGVTIDPQQLAASETPADLVRLFDRAA